VKTKDIMNDAFLCLGGNLGDRAKILESCRTLINIRCGRIVKESKIYETEAWGSRSENKFLNQALHIKTKYSATALIKKLLSIEKSLGRKRDDLKNSDRLIDIDILFFNDEIIKSEKLVVPHPRLHLRKFVLTPLSDLDKKLLHPVLKKTVKKLYDECKDKLLVKEFIPVNYICIEGNIGSGKTTLAIDLANKTKGYFLPEEFEKNDLLPLFYSDPATFAFPLEYSFLLSRYQHISDAFKQETKMIISDYSFYKCLWFAKLNLSKKDYFFFKKHFKALEHQIEKPDFIIYLDTSTKNLKKNIRSRGREYEQNIPEKYLDNLTKQYLKGLKSLDSTRVLIIPVKKYHSLLSSELIKIIKKHSNKIL